MTSKRTISASNETAMLDKVVRVVLFVRMDFSSGVQRFHTEIGPKTITHPVHGSESYTGLGDFGGITSEIIESIDGTPRQLSIGLTGVKSSLINTALTDDYHRRDIDVLIGLEDVNGDSIDDPEYLFSGFMDKVDISLARHQGTMQMICESRGTNLLRAPDYRFTDEDKQSEVSGDLAAEYVYRMQDLTLVWGGKNATPAFDGGGAERYPSRRQVRLH